MCILQKATHLFNFALKSLTSLFLLPFIFHMYVGTYLFICLNNREIVKVHTEAH